jgi:hypothetical protein
MAVFGGEIRINYGSGCVGVSGAFLSSPVIPSVANPSDHSTGNEKPKPPAKKQSQSTWTPGAPMAVFGGEIRINYSSGCVKFSGASLSSPVIPSVTNLSDPPTGNEKPKPPAKKQSQSTWAPDVSMAVFGGEIRINYGSGCVEFSGASPSGPVIPSVANLSDHSAGNEKPKPPAKKQSQSTQARMLRWLSSAVKFASTMAPDVSNFLALHPPVR